VIGVSACTTPGMSDYALRANPTYVAFGAAHGFAGSVFSPRPRARIRLNTPPTPRTC